MPCCTLYFRDVTPRDRVTQKFRCGNITVVGITIAAIGMPLLGGSSRPVFVLSRQFARVPIMSATVRDMLRGKSDVHTVGPGDTVYDALRLMADKNIGAVLVQSDQKIDGIFSERDYARKVILLGKTSKETLVSEIMTTRVVSVESNWTADQCMALMTEKPIRHLPVVEQGRLMGIISIGDVVRAVVDEQQFTINSLQRYITS